VYIYYIYYHPTLHPAAPFYVQMYPSPSRDEPGAGRNTGGGVDAIRDRGWNTGGRGWDTGGGPAVGLSPVEYAFVTASPVSVPTTTGPPGGIVPPRSHCGRGPPYGISDQFGVAEVHPKFSRDSFGVADHSATLAELQSGYVALLGTGGYRIYVGIYIYTYIYINIYINIYQWGAGLGYVAL